jgi:hypothetical protein
MISLANAKNLQIEGDREVCELIRVLMVNKM